MTAPSFTCPVCGATSHHPTDVAEGYCGACHAWTGSAEGKPRDDRAACPYCGYRTDAATAAYGPDDQVPEAGAVSICFGCGELAVFTGDGLLTRRPSEEERADMLTDPDVVRARGLLLAAIAEGKGGTR